MTFKIEKDVPIPLTRRYAHYPFGEMEVGDSFLVPADDPSAFAKKGRSSPIASAASQYAKNNGIRLTTERQPDGSVRVWRLPDPESVP